MKEDQLKKAFEKCSSAISNISIVTKGLFISNSSRKIMFDLDGQSKGFGFITFDKLEDAQKAVQTMNGQKVLGKSI